MPMQIVFDKVCYVPGSTVTGHVIIIKKNPEKVKGLTLNYKGRAKTLIKGRDGQPNSYKEEIYFDERVDLFGHDGTTTRLPVGESLYSFKFDLPTGLPSSFEWDQGNVLYIVGAKLTRSSWKEDKRITNRLPVEGTFDLNLDPLAPMPAEIKHHKYFQHLWTKTGPYGLHFKVPRSGFVRGHSIPFSVEIKNHTKMDLKRIKVSLLQEIRSDAKSSLNLVEEIKGPAVGPGQSQSWESRLRIPYNIPPTNLGNLLNYPIVIPVQYCLQVQLVVRCYNEEQICGKIPIVLGTVSMVHPCCSPTSNMLRFPSRPRLQIESMMAQFSPMLSRSMRPPRRYQYYHEVEDEDGSGAPMCIDNCCCHLRRDAHLINDSPPPSYDEVFNFNTAPPAPTSTSSQSHYPEKALKIYEGRRTSQSQY